MFRGAAVNRHAVREVIRQLRESGGRGVIAVALIAVAAAWAGAQASAPAAIHRDTFDNFIAAFLLRSND